MDKMAGAPYSAAATLGAVSGLRAAMAPAVISWAARKWGVNLDSTPFSAFKGPGVGRTAVAVALGEILTDKTPFVPNRTDSTALLGRAVSGAAAGAAVFKFRQRNILLGAAIGSAAAVGAAYGSFYLRKAIRHRFDLSDRAVGLIEDGVALTAGLIAVAVAKNGAKTDGPAVE